MYLETEDDKLDLPDIPSFGIELIQTTHLSPDKRKVTKQKHKTTINVDDSDIIDDDPTILNVPKSIQGVKVGTKEEVKLGMGLKTEKVNLFKKKTNRESKTDRNERLFMQPVLEERGRKENKKREIVKNQKRDSSG